MIRHDTRDTSVIYLDSVLWGGPICGGIIYDILFVYIFICIYICIYIWGGYIWDSLTKYFPFDMLDFSWIMIRHEHAN